MKVRMSDTINRFEVIDETGRAYVREGVSIELSYQDEGRTLKAFLTPGKPVEREKGWLGKLLTRSKGDSETGLSAAPAKRPSSKSEQG